MGGWVESLFCQLALQGPPVKLKLTNVLGEVVQYYLHHPKENCSVWNELIVSQETSLLRMNTILWVFLVGMACVPTLFIG